MCRRMTGFLLGSSRIRVGALLRTEVQARPSRHRMVYRQTWIWRLYGSLLPLARQCDASIRRTRPARQHTFASSAPRVRFRFGRLAGHDESAAVHLAQPPQPRSPRLSVGSAWCHLVGTGNLDRFALGCRPAGGGAIAPKVSAASNYRSKARRAWARLV